MKTTNEFELELADLENEAKEKTEADAIKELASSKGYSLSICHDCVLLIKIEDLKAYPQPNQKFDRLADVKEWLICQKT